MNFAKKLPSLVPEFLVKDLTRSLAFYRDVLGFKLEFERAESNFAMVSLGEAWIMLEQTEGFSKASPNASPTDAEDVFPNLCKFT